MNKFIFALLATLASMNAYSTCKELNAIPSTNNNDMGISEVSQNILRMAMTQSDSWFYDSYGDRYIDYLNMHPNTKFLTSDKVDLEAAKKSDAAFVDIFIDKLFKDTVEACSELKNHQLESDPLWKSMAIKMIDKVDQLETMRVTELPEG